MEKKPDFNALRLELLEKELPEKTETLDLDGLIRYLDRYHLAGRQYRDLRQWYFDHSTPGLSGLSREVCVANQNLCESLRTEYESRFQALFGLFTAVQERLGSDEFLFDFSTALLGELPTPKASPKKSPDELYEEFMLKTGAWKYPRAEREARMRAIEEEELRTGQRTMPHR